MARYDERICRCALNRLFGFRPDIAHAMVDVFGSAAEVFAADRKSLPPGTARYFSREGGISDREYEKSETELTALGKRGCRFLCDADPGYPPLLKECPDHPLGLYVRSGSAPEETFCPDRTFISVVGTRDMSSYGREWCRRIVSDLADTGSGICIVSGLALGCDITAHRAAMERGIPTIAVLPTGIDTVYPRRHAADAARIAGSARCAVITDYPPGTVPLQVNFIRRNRIIAGISEATILIESKERGGGMISARLAFSYDRDVYALPGRIDDTRSKGCNLLIREEIASPVISTDTLAAGLGLGSRRKMRTAADDREILSRRFSAHLSAADISSMADILMRIRKDRGTDIGELASSCGISYRKAAELTSMLESDGLISIDLMQRCTIRIK